MTPAGRKQNILTLEENEMDGTAILITCIICATILLLARMGRGGKK